MRTTGDKQLDEALEKVRKALRKLPPTALGTQTISRRSARARALGQLRSLRATVDRLYPAIIKKAKFTRLKTYKGRADRLKAAGWREAHGSEAVAYYAAAGITVKRLHHTDPDGRTYEGWFVPSWAAAIGPYNAAALREAKNSHNVKRAALTTEILSQ